MKKNKIIIPAMAMILFSTAASISGTVAWFTASRVFETQVGQFNVVETEGNLECEMIPEIGTVYTTPETSPRSIHVRNKNDLTPAADFTSAATDPAVANGTYYYDTTNSVMKYCVGGAWVEADAVAAKGHELQIGAVYRDTTGGGNKKYVATGAKNIVEYDAKPAVLTHGSVTHNGASEGHAFIIDSEETSNSFRDLGTPSLDWCWQKDIKVLDAKTSANAEVDVYVAVSWKMKFTYTFASDHAPVGIYLDLGKSKFIEPAAEDRVHDFTKAAGGNHKEDTARGFRIGFYGAGHDVVWGNNRPLMAVPADWTGGVSHPEGTIVRYTDGVVYQANKATKTTWDEEEWDKLFDLPTYSNSGKYAIGDKVVHEGKVYECKTAIENTAWGNDAWVTANMIDLSIPQEYSDAVGYTEGDKVLHEHKVYQCISTYAAPTSPATHGWNKDEWAISGDITNTFETPASGEAVPSYVDDVDGAGATKPAVANYAAKDYVTSATSEDGYRRVDPATEASDAIGVPERLCVLTKPDGLANVATVTLNCAAWFEGTDPNVVTGAAMKCLSADIVVYARPLVPAS